MPRSFVRAFNRKDACGCGRLKEVGARTCLSCSRVDPIDRLLDKLAITASGCIEWTGTLRADGYGVMGIGRSRLRRVHRYAYELFVGPIPDGLHIDHLCRNRKCVNPSHLEVVTRAENTRRGVNVNALKTHCPQRHPYSPENTYTEGGRRHCRICVREAGRRRDQRKREVLRAAA